MKNKQEVIDNVKRIELKIKDLKVDIKEILNMIGKCQDLDYFEIENIKTYNKMLQDKINELDKNTNIVNMMKWTYERLEN